MGDTTQSRFEELRREARRLESEADSKLIAFAKVGITNTSMSTEIERDLLPRLNEVVDRMGRLLTSMDTAVSAQMSHVYQHHRAKLQEFTAEFRRTKANVHTAREHAELLDSVRRDISSHRAKPASTTDVLLRERSALHAADQTADEILGQASATHDRMRAQRHQIGGAQGRMTGIADSFGGIFQTVDQIRRKKSRDWWITMCCVALCIFFLIWWSFGGSDGGGETVSSSGSTAAAHAAASAAGGNRSS